MAWLPDHEPTWTEILVGLVAVIWLADEVVLASMISWPWLALGFGLNLIAIGPIAQSSIGARIGTWFRDIGVAGRLLALVLFALVVWTAEYAVDLPAVPVTSAVGGMMVAVLVYIIANVATSGGVGGLRAG